MPWFALEDAEPLWGDDLMATTKWRAAGPVIPASATNARFLEIELTDADVFAVRLVGGGEA